MVVTRLGLRRAARLAGLITLVKPSRGCLLLSIRDNAARPGYKSMLITPCYSDSQTIVRSKVGYDGHIVARQI